VCGGGDGSSFVSEYPPDWDVIELGEIGTWLSGGTPSTSYPAYWDGEIPWISAASLKAFEIRESERSVSALGVRSGTRQVPSGTVLFVVRGMSLKSEFRVGITTREVTFGQDCKAILAPAGVNPRFLAYSLKVKDSQILAMVDEAGHGTGRLPSRQLEKLQIGLPGESEQRRVVDILDSLGEAIRSTELLVAKLERGRLSMLRDLLTRGIGEDGALRNPARDAHMFTMTDLGILPDAWELLPLEALLADVTSAMRSGPFGSGLLKSELVENGIPVLGIDNVHVERFVSEYSRFVTPQKYAELMRYAVRPRDVMVTIMGTVGRCCVVPSGIGKALSSKHVWTLTIDQTRYIPELVCLQVNYSEWMLSHLKRDAQGGIMSAIRSDTLKSALVPVPPLHEQEKIWGVLQAVQEGVDAERAKLRKMRELERGLADSLLAGRVRVDTPNCISM
jgi:type I restriction enzyme S subunit